MSVEQKKEGIVQKANLYKVLFRIQKQMLKHNITHQSQNNNNYTGQYTSNIKAVQKLTISYLEGTAEMFVGRMAKGMATHWHSVVCTIVRKRNGTILTNVH